MTDDNTELEILIRVPNDAMASVIVGMLKECNIDATSVGGFTSGFQAEAPGDVSVMVRESDLPKASELLADFRTTDSIDWSQVDVGEPEE